MGNSKQPRKWLWVFIIIAVIVAAGILVWTYRGNLFSSAAIAPISSSKMYFAPTASVNRGNLVIPFANARRAGYDNPTPTFKDVPRTSPYYKSVEGLYRLGIIKGCRSDSSGKYFCPNDPATRSMLAVMAVRSFNNRPIYINSLSTSFSDVPNNYWAFEEIEKAKVLGYINGYGDGTFRPDVVVTRDMEAVVVSRATGKSYNKPVPSFKDVPTTYWAYKEIEGVFQAGYMSGYLVTPTPWTSPKPISGQSI